MYTGSQHQYRTSTMNRGGARANTPNCRMCFREIGNHWEEIQHGYYAQSLGNTDAAYFTLMQALRIDDAFTFDGNFVTAGLA